MTQRGQDEQNFQNALAYDTVVVPRYARAFGDMLLRAVSIPPRARVLDLACRSGYPASPLLATGRDITLAAIDPDKIFLDVARTRIPAQHIPRVSFTVAQPEALPFEHATFTHVIGNLIDRVVSDRAMMLTEIARVLRPGGQLVLTMPLRGSFIEVLDVFREIALCHDMPALNQRIEQYVQASATPEIWRAEVAGFGFEDAVVHQQSFTMEFASGESLLTDPAVLVAAMPEWQWCVEITPHPMHTLALVQHAIDTYFQGRTFETTVIAGCMTARRSAR